MPSNQILTISDITQEALAVLSNETVFARGINREYDDKFAVDGAKIGATLNIRRPARFQGTVGPALNVEGFEETYSPLTLTTQFHIDTQFNSVDLTLSMSDFSARVLRPAISQIATKIDYDMLQIATNNTANLVGTPGTLPASILPFLTAQAYLDAEAAPRDGDRSCYTDPFTNVTLASSLFTYFNPQAQVSEAFRKGMMGKDSGGMSWLMDQNVAQHTYGFASAAPTVTVNGANQGITTGWSQFGTLNITTAQNITLNVGDTFTIAGVYGVNPQNRQSYGKLRNFVVTAAVNAGTGAQTLSISPNIISAGQFQNVNAAPAAGAALTFASLPVGAANQVTGPQSLVIHKNAFTLGMADLIVPEGVAFAGRASDKIAGMSIRVVKQYTINNDSLPTRLDVLYGGAPLYPELSCRVTG